MKLDLSVTTCSGHALGAGYQFAVGMWPGEIAGGIVISEAAFDFVEPCIKVAWPEWHGMRRYGVTEITPQSALNLASALERAALFSSDGSELPEWLGSSGLCSKTAMVREFQKNPHHYKDLAELFEKIAAWLRDASKAPCQHSLLGI